MRRSLALSAFSLLALTACDPRPQSQVDPAAFLGKLMEKEGPEVEGVNATLLGSARQAEEKREYARAVQFYQQLLDSDPKSDIFLLGLAENLRRLGQFDEALSHYNSLVSAHPDNVDAMEGRGLCQLSKGEFDAASDQFKQVLAKDGNRWRSLNAVGILFVMKEMPQEALSYYDQALKIKPDEPAVLNNVGLTMALTQDYPHAIDALVRAGGKLLDTDPQKKRADLNLALVYGLSGDMDKAEQVAKKHLKDSALNNNLGFYAYLADNKELAKAYLNNALSGSAVFYEKAWKNLEVVGGARVEQRDQTQGMGFAPRSARGKKAPFSVYPPAEVQPKADAAPVMPVTAGQDLDALVMGDAAKKQAEPTTVVAPPAPSVAPAPAPVVAPQPQPAMGDSHVEVFPAVPVNPTMEMGGGVRPVSMPIMEGSGSLSDILPSAVPPAANAPEMKLATHPSEKKEPKVAEVQKTPEKSKILEKIRKAKQPEAPAESAKAETVKDEINAILPSEMGEVEPTSVRLKDPRSEMIVFQANQQAKKAAKEGEVQQPVAPVVTPVVPAPADATVVEPKPAPAATTTLKPRQEKTPAPAEAPATAAAEPQAAAPASEPAPIAPAEAETQPVQRKSTLDMIKQIF